jgi:hypothetical protein
MWDMYGTSNDAFFLTPGWATGEMRLKSSNGHTASASPEAAGITATLFALSNLAHRGCDAAADVCNHLLEYALLHHSEAAKIKWLID